MYYYHYHVNVIEFYFKIEKAIKNVESLSLPDEILPKGFVGTAIGGNVSTLTIADASDPESDSSVIVGAVRERRRIPVKDNIVTYKDGKRYVGGKRKEVRFSTKNNVVYELVTIDTEGYVDDPDTVNEFLDAKWVTRVKGPIHSELHNQHDEGDAFRPGYWDSLPDFAELANGCRYRDGRDDNPFDAPREVYPHLVLMLCY